TCVGYLDRRAGSDRLRVSGQAGSSIEILVENGGRINYGPDLRFERKGIDGRVFLGDEELRGWEIAPLPLERVSDLAFEPGARPAPAFYRGMFILDRPGDTFFDVRSLGKGALWINGHNAGRFWNEGPQRTLFVPGVWLRAGENEAIALDLFHAPGPRTLQGGTRGMH
ncbi:MAG TPA: beta galactosidase jelly roll domain-containing protein, partial [Candidatus Baltobacteraceae bacterium]|nr:beta galactosidase jelly roll domain-containing protein [Candidatus Baltobacteraceae bacterium]